VDFQLARHREFWHCDILECIKYLPRRQCYAESMAWSPVQEFDDSGQRVYSEMHTADWW